jgi:hypothetical protein
VILHYVEKSPALSTQKEADQHEEGKSESEKSLSQRDRTNPIPQAAKKSIEPGCSPAAEDDIMDSGNSEAHLSGVIHHTPQ